MKKQRILDLVMAAGAAAAVLMGSFTAFSQSAENVQKEVLRLHIPANSDSEEDQAIKLKLRDFLLEEYGTQLSDSADLRQAEIRAEELLPEIEAASCEFLKENGFEYSAKAELTNMYFTTRTYGDVTLPAGNYNALRVTLGSGEGHNWWCVMFPPLCLPACSGNEYNKKNEDVLKDFEKPHEIKIKFAFYEFLKGLFCGK